MTDRRYWFDPAVIAATRDFVCVRLLTFERKDEIELLTWVCKDPITEQLENTVFTILSPDGKTKLVPGTRYPSDLEADPRRLAARLRELAARYTTAAPSAADRGLPLIDGLRNAVNVAACDDHPLLVVSARDAARREALVAALTALAWDVRYLGRALYVVVDEPAELERVGARGAEGVLLVAAEPYGRRGEVLGRVPLTADGPAIAAMLDRALPAFRPRGPIDPRAHVERGREQGVNWIPVVQAR